MKSAAFASFLTLAAAASYAQAIVINITSHPDDGQIVHDSFGTGGFSSQITTGPLIVGGAGSSQTRTSIMFFELPAADFINSASFSITVDLNDPANNSQHADLWGLGYQSNTVIQNAWALEANSDPNAIGGGLGIPDRVKIQDNFIDGFFGSPPLPHTLSTSPAGNASLQSFLESLYANGAQPGDYAVLRVNADFNVTSFDRWRFFSGDSTTGTPPTLTMDFGVLVIPEPSTALLVAVAGLSLVSVSGRTRKRGSWSDGHTGRVHFPRNDADERCVEG